MAFCHLGDRIDSGRLEHILDSFLDAVSRDALSILTDRIGDSERLEHILDFFL